MSQPPDLAHIAHAELLTPFPQESLRFFTDLFGMEIEHRQGQSVFLRADENVPFGAFATVMDAVKQSGISNVSIVTQPLEKKGSRR